MPAAGDSGLYDLGGNVSEWCTSEEGKGKAAGFSAVSPTDPKAEFRPPRPMYIGFRVCCEAEKEKGK